MNGIDSSTSARFAATMPDQSLAAAVSQGSEAIRRLVGQGKIKEADAVVEFLKSILRQRFAPEASGASEPEPFVAPGIHPHGIASLNLQMPFAPPVDGATAHLLGDPRIEGPAISKVTALPQGSRELAAVTLALDQHEKLEYDAVNQRFFTRLSDHSKVDLCSVYDVEEIMQQNGAFDGNPGGGPGPVGEFLKEKIDEAYRRPFTATNMLAILAGSPQPPAGDRASMQVFNAQIDELKRKLAELEQMRAVLSASTRRNTAVR